MAQQNPNEQITMTRREKWRLEAKAKSGWKAFYQSREDIDILIGIMNQDRQTYEALRSGQDVDVSHLKRMFLELYEKVGELTNCPICFEPMPKENTFIPNCGHLICKTCRPQIANNKCPECRRDMGAVREE